MENGSIFEGEFFGAKGEAVGEVVFTTGMTGYIETLTDSGSYGSIVVQTFPLIGNAGIIPEDFQSSSIKVKAYIAKYPSSDPSNFRNQGDLGTFFEKNGIIGVCGIDTRKLTKLIRDSGVMKGKITATPPTQADRDEIKSHTLAGAVAAVSCDKITRSGEGERRIALLDFGVKNGVIQALVSRGCQVIRYPYNSPASEILKDSPNGIILSNGPGDPADPANAPIIETIKQLAASKIPMFGLDLGHLFLALANGYKIQKMKFGHRGGNQPVKEVSTGRVYISSQSHGYTVEAEDSSFVNVNDNSCEGIDYGRSFSMQFVPGVGGGPKDTAFLFDRFIERM